MTNSLGIGITIVSIFVIVAAGIVCAILLKRASNSVGLFRKSAYYFSAIITSLGACCWLAILIIFIINLFVN